MVWSSICRNFVANLRIFVEDVRSLDEKGHFCLSFALYDGTIYELEKGAVCHKKILQFREEMLPSGAVRFENGQD